MRDLILQLSKSSIYSTKPVIWYHTHEFTLDDFDSLSGKGDFVVTDLKELNI
ncbi:hypothetical protein [Klebsiella pneumoniae]|uniref:hypothetical protein n=1 Tax=Klebsiella pneumoniae TaxID=573 RepID=UPI0020C80878|nr:hypothetical protein [Klebsiella pneumoniae]